MSRQKFVVSRLDFTELCHDKVFYVATDSSLDKRI